MLLLSPVCGLGVPVVLPGTGGVLEPPEPATFTVKAAVCVSVLPVMSRQTVPSQRCNWWSYSNFEVL